MNQKYCPRCKHTVDVDQFYTNRNTPDGLSRYCKPHQRECVREAYWKRKEHINQYRRDVYQAKKKTANAQGPTHKAYPPYNVCVCRECRRKRRAAFEVRRLAKVNVAEVREAVR